VFGVKCIFFKLTNIEFSWLHSLNDKLVITYLFLSLWTWDNVQLLLRLTTRLFMLKINKTKMKSISCAERSDIIQNTWSCVTVGSLPNEKKASNKSESFELVSNSCSQSSDPYRLWCHHFCCISRSQVLHSELLKLVLVYLEHYRFMQL
jgi:hypothetical protein